MKSIRTYVLASLMLPAMVAMADVDKIITIAVPPEGSSGYVMATGYSSAITENSVIEKAVLQPFAGATSWPVRMSDGELHFGQHCGYKAVVEAYNGLPPYDKVGPKKNLRTVLTGYGLPWGIHVIDPNVKDISGLKGKRIFVQVSHTDHVIAVETILSSAGLDPKRDVRILPYNSPQEAVQGLMTGRGDAMAFGLIPALAEVRKARGLHTLNLSPEIVAAVQKADPVWGKANVKAGVGALPSDQDLSLLAIQCGITAGAHVSDETVYTFLKTLFDTKEKWQSVHPLARQYSLERAVSIRALPFHPGAMKYYSENGLSVQ